MQRINEDIKSGQLKQIYLLYGEEAYLRKQYRDRLRNALAAEGEDGGIPDRTGTGGVFCVRGNGNR